MPLLLSTISDSAEALLTARRELRKKLTVFKLANNDMEPPRIAECMDTLTEMIDELEKAYKEFDRPGV